jgi:hypothetical protein
MERPAMTNMMINIELAEQRQAELAALAESHRNQESNPNVRPELTRAFWKRFAPRRSRSVQPVVSQFAHR